MIAGRAAIMVGGLVATIGLGGCSTDHAPPAAASLSVVAIESQPCRSPQPRHGVGTVIANGVALTAAHVVDDPARTVEVAGEPAVVVATSARLDLAVLATADASPVAIEAATTWFEAMDDATAPSVPVAPGPVTIVGSTGGIMAGLPARVTRALTLRVDDVSAGTTVERPAVELDIVVEPGDSGSPIVDADGELIGVIVLRRAPTGVSYGTRIAELPDRAEVARYQGWNLTATRPKTAGPFAPPLPCT